VEGLSGWPVGTRRHRHRRYVYLAVAVVVVLVVARIVVVLVGASGTASLSCNERDRRVKLWKSTVLCPGDIRLLRVPWNREGIYSEGFTPQADVYFTVEPSASCTGMTVMFYQNDGLVREKEYGVDVFSTWAPGESIAFRDAKTTHPYAPCLLKVKGGRVVAPLTPTTTSRP